MSGDGRSCARWAYGARRAGARGACV